MNKSKNQMCDCTHYTICENIKKCTICECTLCKECMFNKKICHVCYEQQEAIECFDEIIDKGVIILNKINNDKVIDLLKKELENARMFIQEVKLQNEVYYLDKKIDVLVDSGEILDEISKTLENRIFNIIEGNFILPPNFYPDI